MKKILHLVALILLSPALASAVTGIPFAEETVTVSTTAIGTTVCGTSPALIQVKSNGIYFTLHSATATPDADDYEASAGDFIEVDHPSRFRAIRSGAADAKIKVTCFVR
jgi:hypothetical protein